MKRGAACLWLFSVMTSSPSGAYEKSAGAPGFDITQAQLKLPAQTGQLPLLDTHMDLRFSETAVEALHNGIPLILQLTLKTRSAHALPWTPGVSTQSWLLLLRYQPLERHYELELPFPPYRTSYLRWERLLEKLEDLNGIPVSIPQQAGTEPLVHQIRLALLIESLPLPMRLQAHFSRAWHLASQWFVCASAD